MEKFKIKNPIWYFSNFNSTDSYKLSMSQSSTNAFKIFVAFIFSHIYDGKRLSANIFTIIFFRSSKTSVFINLLM